MGVWKPRTWIARTTVGTLAIARNGLDQLLQRSLVARLLTLVQGGGHGVVAHSTQYGTLHAGVGKSGTLVSLK